MILKCKQKIEYECMVHEELNFDVIPFIQDSANLIGLYVEKDHNMTITLNSKRDTYEIRVGDYILKDPNKNIIILSKEEFEKQYDIINEEKNE